MSNDNKPTLYYRVTETNEWEGETWYHYFEDGDGVQSALQAAIAKCDYLELNTTELTDDQAVILAQSRTGIHGCSLVRRVD